MTDVTIDTTTTPRDGRNRRVDRSKAACLAACREMMVLGVFRPTSTNVARRAGVSVRTVFQHFWCIEALHLLAIKEDGATRVAILRAIIGDNVTPEHFQAGYADRIVRAAVLGHA